MTTIPAPIPPSPSKAQPLRRIRPHPQTTPHPPIRRHFLPQRQSSTGHHPILVSPESKTIGFKPSRRGQLRAPRHQNQRFSLSTSTSRNSPVRSDDPRSRRRKTPRRNPQPENAATPLPILMERTPTASTKPTPTPSTPGTPNSSKDGYIFVFQDIRGRYKSEGTFVMSRAMVDHKNPKLVDESTDTYDTIAWLIKNIPNNTGRVGVFGISYPVSSHKPPASIPIPPLRPSLPKLP